MHQKHKLRAHIMRKITDLPRDDHGSMGHGSNGSLFSDGSMGHGSEPLTHNINPLLFY